MTTRPRPYTWAEAPTAPRTGRLLVVLSVASAGYSLLQSLVVPALPVLQRDLHTSPTGTAWVFTSLLLSTSVLTPIVGRLGDMFGKKRLLLVTLGVLALGTLLAALAESLPVMIAGRTIQGVGGALFPLGYAIIREEFPRQRVSSAIAWMAAVLGIGGGLGILLAGPILERLDYHWLFWLPLIVIGISFVAAAVVTPESAVRAPGRVDWLGAGLLSSWLVCLLLAVSQAPSWGWSSAGTVGLLCGAAVLLVVWGRAEDRVENPLVDMRMMRLQGVWTTNAATLLLGFGMWGAFTMVPQFVQVSKATGFGFGASTTQAGVYLLPQTLGILIFSPFGGRLSSIFGPRLPLIAGAVAILVSFVFLTAAHSEGWEIYVAMGMLGLGVGFAFASMASLIVAAVPAGQTGVASGMNTIMRTIGGAIAAQIAASVIASNLRTDGLPTEHAYTLVFILCTVVVAAGCLASFAVPRGNPARRTDIAPRESADPVGP